MPQSNPSACVLAQVAVADATIYYDKIYSYTVPLSLEGHIFVGSMVLVPFGRGRTKPRLGVVLALECGQTKPGLKAVLDAAPEETRLTDELLAIVKYLKEATFCTWFEAVRAVIPRGAQYQIVWDEEAWHLRQKLSRTTEMAYGLAETFLQHEAEIKLSPKQQIVVDFLRGGPQSRAAVMQCCGVGRTVADTLVKKGVLQALQQDKTILLQPVGLQTDFETGDAASSAKDTVSTAKPLVLSPAQQQVYDALYSRMQTGAAKPALLHGVTGSGKTAVFLSLIQAALKNGKTALVLVPEIGLTPQMLQALYARFGSLVAVQHSGLSATERVLQWRSIQRGEARVVVGTRSAVFAPLENIGLIVIDEQQERTYQSESAPRYSALEVARRRAVRHGALLLMASATPDVASYYKAAEAGSYELFSLKERYAGLPLPSVQLVDMGAEPASGGQGALSAAMLEALQQTLDAGKQAILLLNRRGFFRVAVCRECGETIKCGDCSVPMVYHRPQKPQTKNSQPAAELQGRLVCHYCGRTHSPAPQQCPTCGGELRYAGFGTQRLEEELAQRLPGARVVRMDMDTTARKGEHGHILARFAVGEADILLGTQMVAKGLNFPNVALVGVLGIDSLLFGQGYRAYENVFSLVTQVVGRSGRAGQQGRAIIQTIDPDNAVLRLAAQQDYEAFYQQEIAFRRLALYPPFCALCQVGFASEDEAQAQAAAAAFSRLLALRAAEHKEIPLRMLGPAPMPVVQVAGSYRYRLTLKCRGDAAFRALARRVMDDYNKEGWPRKVTTWLDFYAEG